MKIFFSSEGEINIFSSKGKFAENFIIIKPALKGIPKKVLEEGKNLPGQTWNFKNKEQQKCEILDIYDTFFSDFFKFV